MKSRPPRSRTEERPLAVLSIDAVSISAMIFADSLRNVSENVSVNGALSIGFEFMESNSYEPVWGHKAHPREPPAQERLNPDDASGDHIDLWLVHQKELLLAECVAQAVFQDQSFLSLAGHLIRKKIKTVEPRPLCRI